MAEDKDLLEMFLYVWMLFTMETLWFSSSRPSLTNKNATRLLVFGGATECNATRQPTHQQTKKNRKQNYQLSTLRYQNAGAPKFTGF
jgi:hypothetical protein